MHSCSCFIQSCSVCFSILNFNAFDRFPSCWLVFFFLLFRYAFLRLLSDHGRALSLISFFVPFDSFDYIWLSCLFVFYTLYVFLCARDVNKPKKKETNHIESIALFIFKLVEKLSTIHFIRNKLMVKNPKHVMTQKRVYRNSSNSTNNTKGNPTHRRQVIAEKWHRLRHSIKLEMETASKESWSLIWLLYAPHIWYRRVPW